MQKYEFQLWNFIKHYFNGNHFSFPISLSKFAPYFQSAERNHIIIGGPEQYIIDGLIAKGLFPKFQE
jgi:hypothetical protein